MTVWVCAVAVFWASSGWSQTTISTGSVQGTITDPSGAVVPNAAITITNQATGRVINVNTGVSGIYTSGALIPGNYKVRVEAKGFKSAEFNADIQVGVTRFGNVKLELGSADQVLEVRATSVQVNTEQATVQGVLTQAQIENLPINGRNFLDLAQLEPGVQIQDGGNFDPTKNGFSSVSFGGRFGRTARIEVDGVDISDEQVGTTTQNIPASAIQEFNLQQSTLDLSTELTSSGAVSVVTKSGTNAYHGEAFYYFRDSAVAAALPSDTPFQRHQFGGNIGGPIVKDKVFFFLDAERTKQDLQAPVVLGVPFGDLSGSFNSPFRETQVNARVDWQIKPDNYHFFARFTYDQNSDIAANLPNSYQPFDNQNHNPAYVVGLDFATGYYTHSIRGGYMKFRNGINDAVSNGNVFNPAPQLELSIGADPFCLTPNVNSFCSGPNYLAPQTTFQSNWQVKYDGTRQLQKHIIRFGAGFNHIQEGGTAAFLAGAPAVGSGVGNCGSGCNPNDPLTYPVQDVILSNGQGFQSEKSAFGLPGGGQGPDNRLMLYIGDAWKVLPNLTLNFGLRYQRDTGRTDSDLAPIPCSQLDPTLAFNLIVGGTPCTGNILDLYGKGLGDRVHQPNSNFGPQMSIAWDPGKAGKTVFRAGIGLFYENNLWNNQLFDRPPRLANGKFFITQQACIGGTPQQVVFPDGTTVTPDFCGGQVGAVANDIATLQRDYQAATAGSTNQANPGFIGNTLSSTFNGTGTTLFAPQYQTPRSLQFNVGMQHEFRRGLVMTLDYVRNVETHTLLAIDTNHVGDARFLNKQNALVAIGETIAANQGASATCPTGTPTAGAASQAAINCYLATFNAFNTDGTLNPFAGTMSDFAQHGLDSGNFLCGGSPCPQAAFPGVNANLGANQMLFPSGRSVYDALQLKLAQNIGHPSQFIRNINMQVAYSFSKYTSMSQDNDFVNVALDNNFPTFFHGATGLDRRHQVSFGSVLDFPLSFRLSMIGHFYSPLPSNVYLPTSGNPGGIFVSDVTGDGSGDGSVTYPNGDLMPGTNIGSFGRSFSAGGINQRIANYNNALGPTPAGVALLGANIVTPEQLTLLKGIEQPVQPAPPGQVDLGWLRTLDIRLSWERKIKERFTISPGVSFFNVANFANFDSPSNALSPILNAFGNTSPGAINSTTATQRTFNRIGVGTGVFGLGSPRALEFGLKVIF